MELSIGNKLQPLQFRFENTKHKLGVRIWGDRRSFRELHELLGECWDCENTDMSPAEGCSYIGVISYFSYEVRHAFMGHRLVTMDGKPVKEWTDEMCELFEEEMERFEVGMELSWPHMLFIMASWWECQRHQDCPMRVMDIMREFMENIEQLLRQRSKTQYPKIGPYLHGAIYAANPYLLHFMEHINYEYLRWTTFGRVPLSTLADEMAGAAFGSFEYEDFMSSLKRQAKKLNCPIEEMHAEGYEWVYEIEL